VSRHATLLGLITLVMLMGSAGVVWAAPEEAGPEPAAGGLGIGAGLLGLAAALAVGLGAIGTAVAQARIGSAAAGALAERPEVGGTLLVFLALPETMIILGFAIAFLVIGRIR
jgi:V/A-type H+-transporting ATPase subunit K